MRPNNAEEREQRRQAEMLRRTAIRYVSLHVIAVHKPPMEWRPIASTTETQV